MPRVKRTQLPKVTPELLARYPHCVRPTPNGGLAWTCSACHQYASLTDAKGHLLCHYHAAQQARLHEVIADEVVAKVPLPLPATVERSWFKRLGAFFSWRKAA